MKTTILAFLCLLFTLSSAAPAQRVSGYAADRDDARTLRMNVNKKPGPTRDAIESYFNRKGVTGQRRRGLTTYYASLQVPGRDERMNVYIRVKKEPSASSAVFVGAGADRKHLIDLEEDKTAARAVNRLLEDLEKEVYAQRDSVPR